MNCLRDILICSAMATLLVGASYAADPAAKPSNPAGAAKLPAAGNTPQDFAQVQPQYWFGVAVENIPSGFAKQLKLRADQGLMIVAVLPDSPAEKVGLKADDLLIELNGQPLNSQEDLARAANTRSEPKVDSPAMKTSVISFLREGDKQSVSMTPALRPTNMMAMGQNTGSFTPQLAPPPGAPVRHDLDMRNFVLPNGNAAQVGPGYELSLEGDSSTFKLLRTVIGKGETVVMTEETDSVGARKCTITVGNAKYVVEAGKLDTLPPELVPLAEGMLANHPAPQKLATPERDQRLINERMEQLEKQNEQLQKQSQMLMDMLKDLQKQLKNAPADQAGK